MILALLLAYGLPSTEMPSQRISFACEVSSAAIAVKSLSKSTGVPMEIDPSAAAEVVFLKVENLPLAEVMTSLARVTASEWKKEGGVYRLRRSESAVQNERNSANGRRLKYLQDWRKDVLKGLATDYNAKTVKKQAMEFAALRAAVHKRALTPAEESRYDQLRLSGPAPRALARCLREIDLSKVATAEDLIVFHPSLTGANCHFKSRRGQLGIRFSVKKQSGTKRWRLNRMNPWSFTITGARIGVRSTTVPCPPGRQVLQAKLYSPFG